MEKIEFIKCKFEDLPIGYKGVSVFIKDNKIFFVDNETIPFQYDRIIEENDPFDPFEEI